MAEAPQLVAPEVTASKIATHLADWSTHGTLYRSRGWFLTRAEGTVLEIAFAAPSVSLGFRIVPVAISLNYDNYDIWPPSLTFTDALTSQPGIPPIQARKREGDVLRDLIVQNHPATGRPFLCLPGIREYHTHPQHSGDEWLRYRSQNLGAPAVIAQSIWQYMTGTVSGLGMNIAFSLQQQPAELSELVLAADPAPTPGDQGGE